MLCFPKSSQWLFSLSLTQYKNFIQNRKDNTKLPSYLEQQTSIWLNKKMYELLSKENMWATQKVYIVKTRLESSLTWAAEPGEISSSYILRIPSAMARKPGRT